MVVIHVKVGDESQFLYNTKVSESTNDVIVDVACIYNGRLKVSRICSEMEEMAKHGTTFPPDILGLTEEQVEELKLKDEWGEICVPHGGWEMNKDPIGRRNGKQPNEKSQEIFKKTIEEAKAIVSKKKIQANVCLNLKDVQEALDMLKGATMIVYPMGLPPHEPIKQELENTEDLSGTQASLQVIDLSLAQLWFSGKEILRGKTLKDYIGRNEKTKITVKLTAAGRGPPGREPVFTEEEKKAMMMDAYRRQEELKGNTPTLKQEVLSKEISKLQHLMVQQEAAQELLLEKTDEAENLRKRVAELETKTPRDIEERIKFLESENAKLHKELKESLASNKQLTTVMPEYEKTISQLVTNKEEMVSQYEKTKDEIAQKRDTAISHLNNMEVAFNDVHVKYEKVKSIVELQHGNEKLLKESLEAHTKTIEQQKSNYEKLERHASEKLDGANREILTLKSNHQVEMAKMNAVAKKSDLKIKSLEESLEQKQKEIRKFAQICYEFIEQQDKIFGEEAIVEKNKENHLNLTYQLPSPRKEKRKKKSTIMNIFK